MLLETVCSVAGGATVCSVAAVASVTEFSGSIGEGRLVTPWKSADGSAPVEQVSVHISVEGPWADAL